MSTSQGEGPVSDGDVVKQPDKGVGCQMAPDTYQLVAKGLIEGRTVIDLAESYGVSPSTVSVLRQRHMEMIPTHKLRMATKLGQVAESAADRLLGRLERDEVGDRALPIVLGVSITKMNEIAGTTPPTIVKHISIKQDAVEDILDRLPRANAQILDSQSGAETTQTTGTQ